MASERDELRARIEQLEASLREVSDRLARIEPTHADSVTPQPTSQPAPAPADAQPDANDAHEEKPESKPTTDPVVGAREARSRTGTTPPPRKPSPDTPKPPPRTPPRAHQQTPDDQSADATVAERLNAIHERAESASERPVEEAPPNSKLKTPVHDRGEDLEVRLGAWWITRIGVVLAVIGVVFFGVYVSQYSTPWMRFSALAATSIGIAFSGVFLERKIPKFGSVIHAGGLALCYFTAWAAHAVAPVRVIEDPSLGAVTQAIVMSVVATIALIRNNEVVGALSLIFGYVTCFFSVRHGLGAQPVIFASALLGLAIAFEHVRRWPSPTRWAALGTWSVFAAQVIWMWDDGDPPSFETLTTLIVVLMIAVVTSDLMKIHRGFSDPNASRHRLVIGLATSGGLAVALLADLLLFENRTFDPFCATYFVFGALFLLFSFSYSRARQQVPLESLFFVKGVSSVTLGLLTIYDGRTLWIVLLVQSIVLLVYWRRAKTLVTELLGIAVWLLSSLIFWLDLVDSGGRFPSRSSIWDIGLDEPLMGLYILASTILLGVHAAATRRAEPGSWSLASPSLRSAFFAAVAVFLAYLTVELIDICIKADMVPGARGVAGGVVAVAVLLARHWLPALCSFLLLSSAHVSSWLMEPGRADVDLGTALLLGLITVGIALIARRRVVGESDSALPGLLVVNTVYALSTLTLLLSIKRVFGPVDSVSISVLVFAMIAALSRIRSVGLRPELATYALLVAICTGGLGLLEGEMPALLLAPLVLAWPLALRTRWFRPNDMEPKTWHTSHSIVSVLISTLFSMQLTVDILHGSEISLVFAILGGLFLVVGGRMRVPGALGGSFVLLGAGVMNIFWRMGMGEGDLFVESATGLGVVLIVVLTGLRWCAPGRSESVYDIAWWIGGALVLIMLDLVVYTRPGNWAYWITVCWGAIAFLLFSSGLVARAYQLRIVGLAGLAICVLRVFVVDIHSTFYRIIAFILLGLVFLLVGYIYHRYEKRLGATATVGMPDSDMPDLDSFGTNRDVSESLPARGVDMDRNEGEPEG